MKFTTTKFFAEKVYNNEVTDKAEVGTTVIRDGAIIALKYDAFMKKAMKIFGKPANNTFYRLIAEDGRRSTFHGYKASEVMDIVYFK